MGVWWQKQANNELFFEKNIKNKGFFAHERQFPLTKYSYKVSFKAVVLVLS